MELYKQKLNMEKLQEILDCFVEITGINAAYYENADQNISSRNIAGKNMASCDFCKAIREVASINEACMRCDDKAFLTARETKKANLYKCHIGFWEAVVPLFKGNRPMGFLMIGQVKDFESDDVWDRIETLLYPLNTDKAALETIHKKFLELPRLHTRQVEAASKMLEIIAQNIIASDIILLYDSTVIEKTREYLSRHYAMPVSIKALAAKMEISPSSLLSLFKKQTGTSITEYTEALRMEKSKELLLMTSMSIKEISYACGYEDQNYFSRVFKKKEQTSPKAFREANKK